MNYNKYIKSIKGVKKLIEQYKSITLKDLLKKEKELITTDLFDEKVNPMYAKYFLDGITNFSTFNCTSCAAVDNTCRLCIHSLDLFPLFKRLTCTDEATYKKLARANTARKVYYAIQQRIIFLEDLTKRVERELISLDNILRLAEKISENDYSVCSIPDLEDKLSTDLQCSKETATTLLGICFNCGPNLKLVKINDTGFLELNYSLENIKLYLITS